jgi:FixJ family two-component response regulator
MEPTKPLVLIADNDVAVNSLLAGLLVERGLRCESVGDGEAALARLRAGGVDVLVTDLDMPKLSGQDLLGCLDELATTPRTVVISGYLDGPLEATVRAVPAVATVMRKPFDVMQFADVVHALATPAGGD